MTRQVTSWFSCLPEKAGDSDQAKSPIIGFRPLIAPAGPTTSAVTCGTVMVDVVIPPLSQPGPTIRL